MFQILCVLVSCFLEGQGFLQLQLRNWPELIPNLGYLCRSVEERAMANP